MSIKKIFYLLGIFALFFCISFTYCKEEEKDEEKVVTRNRRFVDPATAIGLAVALAGAIQQAVCTFTDVCGGAEITKKLDALENKLNTLKTDVTSIRKDVEDIWDESKRKWYFKHIDNIIQQRKEVMHDLRVKDYSQRAKDKQTRFLLEVFGTTSKDEYVEKALFHIPQLVVDEGLVTRYYEVQVRNGKSSTEAARLTWVFSRKLFNYQIDGYSTVIFAASIKYKNNERSYNKTMAEVCSWWPKRRDAKYDQLCGDYVDQFPRQPNRRKYQQDFIFNLPELALYPAQLLKTKCSNEFIHANSVVYSNGYLFVAHPRLKKITIVDPATLTTIKTLNIPGSPCGGNCYPYGVSIKTNHKIMAVAAHNQVSGGTSYILLFKISGDLTNPAGLSLSHYYKDGSLMMVGRKSSDIRDMAFCGNRIGYADYHGVVRTWKMPNEREMGWNNGKPVPDKWDRHDWELERVVNTLKRHGFFIQCSNDNTKWIMERTDTGSGSPGVGVIPVIGTRGGDVFSHTTLSVMHSSMHDIQDGKSRMNEMKGIAMDTPGNLLYSSEKVYYTNSISGVYKRTHDAKRHFIREWEKGVNVKMFGLAGDNVGNVYSLQKHGASQTCLYKFYHEIDVEDAMV